MRGSAVELNVITGVMRLLLVSVNLQDSNTSGVISVFTLEFICPQTMI